MHAKLQIAISRFMASFVLQKKIQMLFIQGPIQDFWKGVRFVKSSCTVVIRSRTVVNRGES